ncbi:MAG: hypothetical protein KA120_05260 [Candidatus Goldbacteria bacterium]|nr:hypothetical protein [Candidatus Goldiibacteriota bacterium]
MKRVLILILFLLTATGFVFAGNVANIIAFDTLIGAAGGAALGAALSTPAYLQGGAENSQLFFVGAGWGGIIGASIGLCYSIYHIITYVQGINVPEKKKEKAFPGTNDIYLTSNGTNLIFLKTF